MSDEAWANYLEDRTVAVVGPAPSVGDQSREVDSHDIVIRLGFTGSFAAGYGDRVNVAFYNITIGKIMATGRWDEELAGLDWVITKYRNHTRPHVLCRRAHWPPSIRHPNQVPVVLHDLTQFSPARIAVFGADLYLSGPSGVYDPAYPFVSSSYEDMRRGILGHDQLEQFRMLSELVAADERIVGDGRFMKAVSMSEASFVSKLEAAWQVDKENA